MSAGQLLSETDPAPVGWINADSAAPVLLLCEHAGRAIPRALGDLGLSRAQRCSHIGWDIGARALAVALAERLAAPLIIQRYSRLVIDCNRPPDSAEAFPVRSDGTVVPSNWGLDEAARAVRRRAIFEPLDRAMQAGFERRQRKAAFSIHSFTPRLGGADRPWQAGFLSRRDRRTARLLRDTVASEAPELVLAINQPYQIDEQTDWFIPRHVEKRQLAHSLIEVRNDQLREPDGVLRWAELLAAGINATLDNCP